MAAIIFEVKRDRYSVTQGTATLYVCGEKVCTYGDDIQIIRSGETYYGDLIGSFASKTSDSAFICGALNPKIDYYQTREIKEKIMDIIKKTCEQEEKTA